MEVQWQRFAAEPGGGISSFIPHLPLQTPPFFFPSCALCFISSQAGCKTPPCRGCWNRSWASFLDIPIFPPPARAPSLCNPFIMCSIARSLFFFPFCGYKGFSSLPSSAAYSRSFYRGGSTHCGAFAAAPGGDAEDAPPLPFPSLPPSLDFPHPWEKNTAGRCVKGVFY